MSGLGEAVCILQLEKMNLRNPQVTFSALKAGKTVPIYCWGGRRERENLWKMEKINLNSLSDS